MKKWWAYWAVLALLVFEGGPLVADRLRLAVTAPSATEIVTAKGDTFANTPNVNGTNSLGWRSPEPIVFIGDSVTYGVGVDRADIFTSQFPHSINLGVPGYDMPDVLRVADKWRGARLVYCYCINDFSMIPRGYDNDKGLYRKIPRLSHQVRRLFGGTERYLQKRMEAAPPMTIVVMPFQGPWKGYHVRSLEFIRQYNPLEPAGFGPEDFIDGLHFNAQGHKKMAQGVQRLIKKEDLL